MTEESADTLIEFRADDVFEAASLRMRLGFVDGKSVLKEPLGKAVAADDVAGTLAADGRELRFAVLQGDQTQIRHARENPASGLFSEDREFPLGSRSVQALHLCRLPFFAANPDLLEEMIEANLVIRGNRSATIPGVNEWAVERMARAVQRGIKM